jgi:hypothetical protein
LDQAEDATGPLNYCLHFVAFLYTVTVIRLASEIDAPRSLQIIVTRSDSSGGIVACSTRLAYKILLRAVGIERPFDSLVCISASRGVKRLSETVLSSISICRTDPRGRWLVMRVKKHRVER